MRTLFIICICFFTLHSFSQTKPERINLSYWYVFGRFPSQAEFNYWNGQTEQSLNNYVASHQSYLAGNESAIIETVTASYWDAFGRGPSTNEINYWKQFKQSYTDLMSGHIRYLLADPNENKATINRAYKSVFNRDPNAEEIAIWQQSNIPFSLLKACLNSYKYSYRVQSIDGVVNFLKTAWETTTSFTVNATNAISQAASNTWVNISSSFQKLISMKVSSKTTDELKSLNSSMVVKTENGGLLFYPGGQYIQNASRLINLDGGTLVSERSNGIVLHPLCEGCPKIPH